MCRIWVNQNFTLDFNSVYIIRVIETGEPVVAYLAHPYEGGSWDEDKDADSNKHAQRNLMDSCTTMICIMDKYPNIAIINPLTNFESLADSIIPIRNIIAAEKRILAKVDVLILSGSFMQSAGCMTEFALAYHGYHIPVLVFDEYLHILQPVSRN